ncbi:hypothetical protein Dimus_014773 [Dionaea muscipula]
MKRGYSSSDESLFFFLGRQVNLFMFLFSWYCFSAFLAGLDNNGVKIWKFLWSMMITTIVSTITHTSPILILPPSVEMLVRIHVCFFFMRMLTSLFRPSCGHRDLWSSI